MENFSYRRVTAATEVVISVDPVRLVGYYANLGSTGTATLRDAGAIGGASAGIVVVDATAHANKDLFRTRTSTGLTYQGSAAGTDITVVFEKTH